MTKSSPLLYALLLMFSAWLSGCATQPIKTLDDKQQLTTAQRAAQLLNKKVWRLNGKIAFIQQINGTEKRESASINWQVNENKQTQTLNLTSYLGINVFLLTSKKQQHIIRVDGEEYKGNNLGNLIYSLTGLTLPTKALNFWLKGLPYTPTDQLDIDEKSQLPRQLTSNFHNTTWLVKFSDYRTFNGIPMATNFIITKEDHVIKVAVKTWSLIE